MKKLRLYCFIIVGILWAAAAYFAVQSLLFTSSAVKTAGTITNLETTVIANKMYTTPTFSFVDSTNQKHTVKSETDVRGLSVGDTITVGYDPANPQNAFLYLIWPLWGKTIIFFALGGFLVLIPMLLSLDPAFKK